jgi:energy-coupling factor transport system ATP-binding protein
MKKVDIKKVSYRYPGRRDYALWDFSFKASEGEFILVEGPSGCGKSTLCRLLNRLCPDYFGGELKGSIHISQKDTKQLSIKDLSNHVGLVFQDPESQIVCQYVEGEIAFGLENQGLKPKEIEKRIQWITDKLGIKELLSRKTATLSGGEKQKIVLASVLAQKPGILVLDEPSSQLDPQARKDLFRLLHRLNTQGQTIILVEHNVSEAKKYAHRIFKMGSGKKAKTQKNAHKKRPPGEPVLEVKGLQGGYKEKTVFEDVNISLRQGECLAILGKNGAGKTTLVKHFNGLLRPSSGSVKIAGGDIADVPTEKLARQVAYLPQNPQDMLFCDTVEQELEFTLKQLGLAKDKKKTLQRFGLKECANMYPRDLSVGQKQRVALAAVWVADPKLVVLDEPTRGIDSKARLGLATAINEMLCVGKAVVLVTQDHKLAGDLATKKLTMGARK